jgi:hypothetical protein
MKLTEDQLRLYKLYDELDDFNFLIVNSPFTCNIISAAPFLFSGIQNEILLMTRNLLTQGLITARLKSSFR